MMSSATSDPSVYLKLKKFFYGVFGPPRLYQEDFKYFQDCSNVLDIPCGSGQFLENSPSTIQGADLNPQAIEYCRKKGLRVSEANALQLAFENGSFDGIHCAHLIEHFEPAQALHLLRELDRVLRPGGVLVLRAPFFTPSFFNDPSHVRPYPPSAILHLLNVTSGGDATLMDSRFRYRFVDLKQYGRNFFPLQFEVSVNPGRFLLPAALKSVGMLLGRLGIRHWQRGEFSLVLRKEK